MAIRFACQCGAVLRAQDRVAGRQMFCPACSAPLRVAGSSAERREVDGAQPKSVFVRTRAGRRRNVSANSCQLEEADRPTQRVTLRRPPRWVRLLPRQNDARWWNGLGTSLYKVPVFFRLGIALTVLTLVALAGWVSVNPDEPQAWPVGSVIAAIVFLLIVFGVACNNFNAILSLTARGKSRNDPSIDFAPDRALLNSAQWVACFLAGPMVPAAAALGYWLYSGDLSLIDWMILGELCLVAVGWWLIAVLLCNVGEKRIVWPGSVLATALRMRWRTIEVTLLAAAVIAVHLGLLVHGAGRLHRQPFWGILSLCAAWTSGLYFGGFTFRRLGVAFHLVRRSERSETPTSRGEPATGLSDRTARRAQARQPSPSAGRGWQTVEMG